MNTADVMWAVVLIGMTVAYGVALFGVRAAKQQNVHRHAKWMMASCTLVGLWLAGYVAKQVMFGRDEFPGTVDEYWQYYIPVLVLHTSLAMTTIGLGVANLYTGLTRLRLGAEVETLVNVVRRHRIQGKVLVGTFSGTIVTAYVVYVMLFQWVPS
ncbi:DUF420 domain-containing protein [Nitrospira sp. M1]